MIRLTLLFFLLLPALLFSPVKVLAADSLRVVATDTISGYSAALRTSVGNPGQRITFRVEKPDGSLIELEEYADEAGVAKTDFLGYHTKEVGIYHVTVFVGDSRNGESFSGTFEVFPDITSPIHSQVMATKDSAEANEADVVKIRVTLRDRNGNPIPSHFVDLISSRASENIEPIGNGATNAFGEIYFYITSSEEGISYFSALDRNAGVTLEDRAKAVFFRSQTSQSSSQNQANLFGMNSFLSDNETTSEDQEYNSNGFFDGTSPGESGVIHHFEIDLPNEVFLGKDYNLTIRAVDSEGNVVPDYQGTIELASTDESASLPGDSEKSRGRMFFTAEKMGVATASLAMKFGELGQQTITAYEWDSETGGVTNITGEKTVTVVGSCVGSECNGGITPPPNSNDPITITTPSEESEISGTNVIIAGVASLSGEVRVFVDNIALKTITVDQNGSFTGTITVSKAGSHVLVVKDSLDPTKTSQPIPFSIRNLPPELLDFSVSPSENVSPGASISVTLSSEANLQEASISLEGKNVPSTPFSLLESSVTPGIYAVTFPAPVEPGTYTLSVRLKDSFGLVAEPNTTKTITVQEKSSIPVPENLETIAGDGEITLSWSLPEDETSPSKFELFLGTTEEEMEKTSEALGKKREKTFTNLENDTMYFFRLRAIDANGEEGEFSETVSATPEGAGGVISPDIPFLALKTQAGDGKVKLTWDDPLQKTSFFVIRFGVESGKYTEQFSVDGKDRSAVIDDLVNDAMYYFHVQPFDKDGIFTGDEYEERSAMPLFSGLRSAPHASNTSTNDKTPPVLENKNGTREVAGRNGPEHIFLLFVGLSFALAMFSFQRSLLFFREERHS